MKSIATLILSLIVLLGYAQDPLKKTEIQVTKRLILSGDTIKKDSLVYVENAIDSIRFHYINGTKTKWYLSSSIKPNLAIKLDKNPAIIGATKTKITYDAKGLVTAGADATTIDIAPSTDRKYITDAEKLDLHAPNSDNQDLTLYRLKSDMGDFIQNQNASAQIANMWITGDINSASLKATTISTGTKATLTASGTATAYPRGSFLVGSTDGDAITNAGLTVAADVSSAVQKPMFVEVKTNVLSSASCMRFALKQSTVLAELMASSNAGATVGNVGLLVTSE